MFSRAAVAFVSLLLLVACSSSSSPGAISYSSLVLAAHPSAYWHLDSLSPTVIDASGNHTDATLSSGAVLAPGPLQNTSSHALFFTAPASVSVSHPLALGPHSSLEFWVNYPTYTQTIHLFRSNGTSPSGGFRFVEVFLNFSSSSHFLSLEDFSPAKSASVTATAALAPSTWHYLVLTDDGTAGLLYQDGLLVGNGPALSDSLTASTSTNNPAFEFGSGAPKSLSEVALYPLVLTPSQILAHYHAGCACST